MMLMILIMLVLMVITGDDLLCLLPLPLFCSIIQETRRSRAEEFREMEAFRNATATLSHGSVEEMLTEASTWVFFPIVFRLVVPHELISKGFNRG